MQIAPLGLREDKKSWKTEKKKSGNENEMRRQDGVGTQKGSERQKGAKDFDDG